MVWSVPAIHGDIDQLARLHDHIFDHIAAGDRILYHGNYVGYGEHSKACVDEILTFRRMILARSGFTSGDFVFLRGQQELILEKLLQLQFAPDPTNVLLWMLSSGLSNTLYDYNLSPHDGIEACRQGIMSITRWTNNVRKAIRAEAGHEMFFTGLKRMAHTDKTAPAPMLFVHAGLNPAHAIHDQGDHIWWASDAFRDINAEYKPFAKVVRGFDPDHRGLHLNGITATVDNGCGFGGNLVSVGFNADGKGDVFLEV